MATYNTNEQVYNAQGDKAIGSRLAAVICVLVQRGMFIAGFSPTNELLNIHYTSYNANKPVWALDFFEHIFSTDPALANKDIVKGVFVSTDKTLIVPEELYSKEEAEKWLSRIHFVEATDLVCAYALDDEKAYYLQAVPVGMLELIKINFARAEILPVSIYQFHNPNAGPYYTQICLSGEQVSVTLHNAGRLLWHKVYGYGSAEDIAYSLKQYCRESDIDPALLNVSCTGLSASEFETINELTQYFPKIKAGNGSDFTGMWDGAISLAQQLFACVS